MGCVGSKEGGSKMNFFNSMAKKASDHIQEQVEEIVEDVKEKVLETDDVKVEEGGEENVESNKEETEEGNKEKSTIGEGALGDDEFEEKAKLGIPGLIRMFSGCMDTQTSADVSNVATFELPEDAGPGGAGGACTNSLIKSLTSEEGKQHTWVELLDSMRVILKEKGFTQIPQLSSSRKLDVMHETFSVNHPEKKEESKQRAVLIGINYVGQRGELRGCHNDVIAMKKYLETQGYTSDDMKVLMDDGQHENPTRANMLSAMEWLVQGAEEGDSLFLHYSGHGGYKNDNNDDEKDGKDETLVPVDFQSADQIIDDIIFQELVMPVPKGVMLTCVIDACHSGTVLDLPYMIKATEGMDEGAQMQPNPGFSFTQLLNIAKKLYALKSKGASNDQLMKAAAGDLMPLFGGQVPGGLGNLLSMATGSGGNAPSGGGGMSSLPSLPF